VTTLALTQPWSPVTTDEHEKLIGSAPCKTCSLDTAPTCLVKNTKALLSPFVTLLWNKSLGCRLLSILLQETGGSRIVLRAGIRFKQGHRRRALGWMYLKCFYWLCQIRRISGSLDTESAKTLVHAFVSSRVDGCNAVLAGSSKATTERLRRELNAQLGYTSAELTLETSAPLRAPLAGCSSAYPVQTRSDWSSVSAGQCFSVPCGLLQVYNQCCQSSAAVCSASRHQLIAPRHRRTKFSSRAFSAEGPTACRNSLPDYLRDPSLSKDTFRRSLKTYLFALY